MLSFKTILLITIASHAAFTSEAPIADPDGANNAHCHHKRPPPSDAPSLSLTPGVNNGPTPVDATCFFYAGQNIGYAAHGEEIIDPMAYVKKIMSEWYSEFTT